MKRITRIIRPIICMAVLLFAMTTAVMGCYQKETEPIDIPGRTPSGTSAPQPSATPAGEVIPSVDRQAELAEARAKNPDTVAWLYIPFSLSSRCFLIGSSPCGLSFLLFHALHGLFRKAVVHQRVKVHPLRLRQLAGLGHHRLQPLQRRARHHGRGVPRVDLPVTGGDGLQRIQIGVRELVDDGLRHLPVGVRFTKLYRYMDADFAKEHPYIHLSADGEDMIFQITALFITDTGFDYIDPNPMGSKLTEFFQAVEKKN